MAGAAVCGNPVRGTGSALRRRLMRTCVQLALTAGFVVAGWLLCGTTASAASATLAPAVAGTSVTTPSDGRNDNGGLLGSLLGNTVNSLGNTVDSTVNSLLGTVNSTVNTVLRTVNTVTTTVSTTVVTPAVNHVTDAVAPVVTHLVPKTPAPSTTPARPSDGPPTPVTAATPSVDHSNVPVVASAPIPLAARDSPVSAPPKAVARHATRTATVTRTGGDTKQTGTTSPTRRRPQLPAPPTSPQPNAPAPTVSAWHGPTGGSRHALAATTPSSAAASLRLLATVAGHPILVPGETPGLPSVSPD